jgi:hypothetical protein
VKALRIAVFSMIAVPFGALAAQDTQGIVYDYLTGFLYRETEGGAVRRIQHLPSVSAGNPVQLKVINLNTLKYTIEISRAEAKLFTSVPSALDVLLPPLPSKALVEPDVLAGDARSLGKGRSGSALVRAEALTSRVEAMSEEMAELDGAVDALEELGTLNEDLQKIVKSWPDPRIEGGKPPVDPRDPGRMALVQLREAVKKLVQAKLDAVVANAPDVRRTSRWRDITRAISSDVSSRTRALDRLSYEFEDDALALAGQLEAARALATSSEEEKASEFTKLTATLSRLKRQIAEGLQTARERSAAIRSTAANREKSAESAERLYDKIMNEDVFEKAAPPVTPRGDIMRFSIRVTAPADEGGPPLLLASSAGEHSLPWQEPDRPQVDVEVRVVGRMKIDYSAGIFISNLRDGSYFLSEEGKQMIVREGAEDDFSFSFGALAHVYRTSAARWVPAFSFGVAGGNDSGIQLLLGVSVMTGHEQRFVFTAGIIGAKVTRLNGAKVGQPFLGSESSLTKDVYRTGMFLGVTFNLR